MLRTDRIKLGVLLALCGAFAGCGSDNPPPAPSGAGYSAPPPRVAPTPGAPVNNTPGITIRPVPEPAATPTANREGESVTQSLAIPTGDKSTSVLLLEKTFPAQARLGKVYRYE